MRYQPKQRKKAKQSVNAYLFLLAKRLAQSYYFGIQNPTDLQFIKKTYDRHKSVNFIKTSYFDAPNKQVKNGDLVTIEKIKLDPYAQGIARRIHKILKTKELYFTDSMLDSLVKEIRFANKFGGGPREPEYKTWRDFVTFFQNDRGVIDAKNLCGRRGFDKLSLDEKNLIQDAVETRLVNLLSHNPNYGYHIAKECGQDLDELITIANTYAYVIRTADRFEIYDFFSRSKKKLNTSVFNRTDFYEWHDVYKNFIYIYLDEHGMQGYISVLPVTETWVSTLLQEREFNKKLLISDVIDRSKNDVIKFVLIEAIDAASSRAKALIKFYLPAILEVVVKHSKTEFTVLYITDDSLEKDKKFIERYGFKDYDTLHAEDVEETKTIYFAKGSSILNLIGE